MNETFGYFYKDQPDSTVASLLADLRKQKWSILSMQATLEVAREFQIVKVPVLVVYNNKQEETRLIEGNFSIIDFLKTTLSSRRQ